MKIAYSEKHNQFYEIMRIDNDVGGCYIKITSNRRDKKIHRDMILRTDTEKELKIVVMHDSNVTSERHFIEIMESDCPYKIKLSELKNFKKNMLMESDIAMEELEKTSKIESKDKEIQLVQTAALKLLFSMKQKENVSKADYVASYENQIIPSEIMKIALSKRLFIERSDEVYRKRCANGNRVKAIGKKKHQLQTGRSCGFIIRDRGGFIIAGKGYVLTVQEVIEFVKNYIPTEKEKQYTTLYKVPMSDRKERQMKQCAEILKKHGLHYKNEHNYFFWILDKRGNVIAGGKNGFGFKWFKKYCDKLKSGTKKKSYRQVTGK